jgi:hypothetical protein
MGREDEGNRGCSLPRPDMVKGKRWLLLTRWINLSSGKRQELSSLFALNRKVVKAYVLIESLDRL